MSEGDFDPKQKPSKDTNIPAKISRKFDDCAPARFDSNLTAEDEKRKVNKRRRDQKDIPRPNVANDRRKIEKTLKCIGCGNRWDLTQGEAQSIRAKGYEEPKRCQFCRKK
jgi:hypothetical protein